MDKLGRKGKDKVTGMEGIISEKNNCLYGCTQYLISNKHGNYWVDEGRIIFGKKVLSPKILTQISENILGKEIIDLLTNQKKVVFGISHSLFDLPQIGCYVRSKNNEKPPTTWLSYPQAKITSKIIVTKKDVLGPKNGGINPDAPIR